MYKLIISLGIIPKPIYSAFNIRLIRDFDSLDPASLCVQPLSSFRDARLFYPHRNTFIHVVRARRKIKIQWFFLKLPK